MLNDIVEVTHVRDFLLLLRFEDGTEGEVDIRNIIQFSGIFEELTNPALFAQVQLNREWGTIFWPNGADLDPDVLYAAITGQKISNYTASNDVA